MRIVQVVSCLLVSSFAFAFDLPKICENLYLEGCAEGSRADYRLNVEAYENCFVALSALGDKASSSHKVSLSLLENTGDRPLYSVKVEPKGKKAHKKILITSGIHGNEAVGPVALIGFLVKILKDNLYKDTSFRMYPMLNPWGLKECLRKNQVNKDLNRELHDKSSFGLYSALKEDMEGIQFIAGFDMHEAGGKDFFVLANGDEGVRQTKKFLSPFAETYGEHLVRSQNGVYPYKKPGRSYTFYAPGVGTSLNSHTVKSFMHYTLKIPFAVTTEAPVGMKPLQKRTELYETLIKTLVDSVLR